MDKKPITNVGSAGHKKTTAARSYPTLGLRKAIVFPEERANLVLEGVDIIKVVDAVIRDDREVVLVFQKNGDISTIGVMAKVLQSWYLTAKSIAVTLEGLHRVEIKRTFVEEGVNRVEIENIVPVIPVGDALMDLEVMSRSVHDQFRELMQLEGIMPVVVTDQLQKPQLEPETVSNMVCSALSFNFQEKLTLLETLDVKKRLEILNTKLGRELSIVKAEKKIVSETAKGIGELQREQVLQEQLRAIEKELGIFEEQKEFRDIEQKIKKLKLPTVIKERALKELNRLKRMPPASAEAPYISTYLDWITNLPWSKKSKTELDITKAKEILDQDHYGLQKAKERVLEYLAVQKLTKGKGHGTILCFVGPPGTGKTSVGKSIARALGREFVRISLGGIRDEAEIRGHRRTYVGALPGRIIQQMRVAKTSNPVFMMDEIDKIGTDFRGDPSTALLEVLDPEQNNAFSDHYLELPFDLSEVFFITTANILDPILPALQDRMEVIDFPGYTDDEKYFIAKKYLLPKVMKGHGLTTRKLDIDDGAVKKIINKYTREAGVRNVERSLAEIARKIAKKIAEKTVHEKVHVSDSNLAEYLGPEKYHITMREEKDEIGVATGLAWTPAGGEIIFIETSHVPGKGALTLTGHLGDVMQESAKAAVSYIRSRSEKLKIKPDFYYKSDIHIHVPAGAIPKDGPSSGIAIATALASVFTGKKVKKEVALTGEVTLSGKVLEVGGIKEKVLAAHRAGVEVIVLPKDNEKDLVDIPEKIRKELKFEFVKHMDDVLRFVFV